MAGARLISYLSGYILRYFLFKSSISENIEKRVEVSTPVSSWKRVTEGVHLYRQGVSPYSGDVFHESPLSLLLYEIVTRYIVDWVSLLFVLCDLLTAFFLGAAARKCGKNLAEKESNSSKFVAESSTILLQDSDVGKVALIVETVYLLCPFSILACVGRSTSVFTNLLLSLSFFCMVYGFSTITAVILALATYQSFYPVMLVVPTFISAFENKKTTKERVYAALLILLIFVSTLTSLLIISFKVVGSWDFLWSTYGTIVSVPDLTPNVGLFWYFFTEMFDHFRIFFLWTFQINAFIYMLPLSVRLRKEYTLLVIILLALTAVFKSYPSVADTALYLSLLPLWKHLFPYMRQTFIVGCIILSCTVLAPVLWFLWIYPGSANANFYFGITLAYNTAQIFLITDLLFAYIKRDYILHHGKKTEVDGKPVQLELR
ncbi:phosphatidylinositol glycan anchor biosynthesis class U protein-like [Limulus polyphemus]|uniref:Phosphatidylinositol glycan anchor biosynthesis class U protein-like n=1 Tax=Limulus polyphemus TaxID=6850 RepID=A0ABM1BRU7_LIMPO|nr:phosphatidylinositol glycan anchor biosynthesis class U protein-like [Limulus polyphemus]